MPAASRDELLYRFEFPERPGALLRFLQAIGTRWNISLFHYRNHGSDYGRVLAGIQVPEAERAEFLQHLNELHYPYIEETRQSRLPDVPRRLKASGSPSLRAGRSPAATRARWPGGSQGSPAL